ncbi:MAG: glycyl-radical enzyme activating protein [Ignavibacteriaceae bacterium]
MRKTNNFGMLFDIHRFSLHDGPGIRTTVFLKGCPLDCKWCHNPESQAYKPQISFNQEKCNNCFDCIELCTKNALQIKNDKLALQYNLCDACGDCIPSCTNNALKIYGYKQSTDEVIRIVLKDKEYYDRSGGGLTISGGEPMTQFQFTKELLVLAKLNGLHSCIETCGFAPSEKILEINDFVDLFLFDYKESDPNRHKLFTGASNDLILKNLELLYKKGANIILRCPIIPGINDTENHFNEIKRLHDKYPNLAGIELMAYHNIGNDKADQIGMKNNLKNIPTTDIELKSAWLNSLKNNGCENVTLG